MPITANHVFTSPIADGTNTQIVRPSNWNSSHLVTMNAVGSEISGAFSNSNNVTFGLATNGYMTATATLHASKIPVFGNYTEDADVQHMINDGFSPGWIGGGTFSTTTGNTFTVGTGEGWIRTANIPTARLQYISWDSGTVSVPSGTVARYVVVSDNGVGGYAVTGLSSHTTSPHLQLYLGEAHNVGGTLIVHNDKRPAGDFARRLVDYFIGAFGTVVANGEVVSDPSSPSRKLKITAGDYWDPHMNNYTDSAIDTSVAGTFTDLYRDGAGDWVRTASQTDWENTTYDDGTGTPAAMTAGSWSNRWVLRGYDGKMYVQRDTAEYTSQQAAEAASFPATRPEEIEEHGFYVAQIVFKKSDTFPTAIIDSRPTIRGVGGAAGVGVDTYNVLAGGGVTAGNADTINFGNSNGITFGLSANGTMTASHNGLTTAAQSNHSHGNPTLALTNLSGTTASNSAGFTLSLSAGAGGAGDGFNNLAAGTQTANTTGTVLFNNSNGVTFGMSNNSVITATVKTDYQSSNANYLTSQSNQALSGSNGSFTFQTATFGSSNGMHFYTTNGSLVGSYTVPTQSNQNVSLYALGNTTQNSSTVLNASNMSFNGLGAVTVGFSNGSIQFSAPSAGAGNVSFSAGTRNDGLAAITFANSNDVSFGLNTNGVMTASVVPGGGAAPVTFNSTVFGDVNAFAQSTSSLSQNSIYIFPENLGNYVSGAIIKIPVFVTNSSSAFAAHTRGYTGSFAVYTRNATNSTVLASHYSTSYTASMSANSNASWRINAITAVGNSTSYNTISASSAGLNLSASIHGARELIMPWSSNVTPGEYWFAFAQSSSSAGAVGNLFNISHLIGSSSTQNRFGVSQASNALTGGIQSNIMRGVFSATSGAFPANINGTDINGKFEMPIIYFLNNTV